MTNEQSSAAQNKMGELYIDLGEKGGKTLVNTLSKTALGLFGAKKAADLFTKPLKQMWKEAGADVVALKKLSVSLGTSFQQLHKLRTYLKERNLSEGLIDDLGSLQDKLWDITHGMAGLDANMAKAMNILGLNIDKYDGSLESTLQLTKDIQKATANMSDLDRAQILRMMGMSKEFATAMQKGDFDLSKALSIPDEKVKKMLDAEDALAKLKTDWDNTLMGLAADWLPEITPAVASLSTTLPTFAKAMEGIIETAIPALEKLVSWIVRTSQSINDLNSPNKTKKQSAQMDIAQKVLAPSEAPEKFIENYTKGDKENNFKNMLNVAKNSNALTPLNMLDIVRNPLNSFGRNIKNNHPILGNIFNPGGSPTGGAASVELTQLLADSLGLDKVIREDNRPPIDFIPDNIKTNNPMIGIPSDEQHQMMNSLHNNVNVNITHNNNISSTDPQGVAREISHFNEQDISLAAQQAFYQSYPL